MARSDTARPATPAAEVQRIASEEDARALAYRLLTPGRPRPTVVLTIAGGHTEPFGDPEDIKEAVGDLADVVVMPTSDVSWAFSREMPSLTQVYGGAGRVYPMDHGWVNSPSSSRLRFAYAPEDGRRVTELLINDALEAALAGGLFALRTSPDLRRRTGKVAGVIASRALVTLDDGASATVWEELTVPGVALDRVVVKGQTVEGVYDPASRRLDLRGGLRYTEADAARAAVRDAYRVGDVVLADVAEVTEDAVGLRLLPGLSVGVDRSAVTSNPNDTLRELFTLDEVVLCRIAAVEPLRLRLDDIDEDEAPKPAPALLPGGPPWLRLAEPERPAEVAAPVPPAAPAPAPAPVPAPVPAPAGVSTGAPRRPSPLDMVRRGAAAAPAPAPVPRSDAGSLENERTRVLHLTNELAAERATRNALSGELAGLRARAAGLQDELDAALRRIEQLQTRYRSADLARQRAVRELRAGQSRADRASGPAGPAFPDPVDQFRHEVYCAWVQRIPAAEKATRPLADFDLGPHFLASVEQVEGVSRSKVVAVVVEVLTGQVQHLSGRDAHQLRVGDAGTRYVTRADGATCWRVALQQDSAAARRLHYWRIQDRYEFSRVVLHDDYRP